MNPTCCLPCTLTLPCQVEGKASSSIIETEDITDVAYMFGLHIMSEAPLSPLQSLRMLQFLWDSGEGVPTNIVRHKLTSCALLLFPGIVRTGYPIMAQVDLMSELIDEKTIRSSGSWNVFHILGHRHRHAGWQFPLHSTAADCNLWNVYLHEEVLDIPRARAHPNLTPELRQERIRKHMDVGAPLRLWNSWTALETYLQVLSRRGGGDSWVILSLSSSGVQRHNVLTCLTA